MSYDIEKPDEQWRAELTPAEYAVLRQAGTEPAFVGEYTDTKTAGVYSCRACGAELFRSDTKFESHCGWPSFYDPKDTDAVELIAGPQPSAWSAPRCAARAAARTWGTSSRARATRPRPTSGTASTRSRCAWHRTRADATPGCGAHPPAAGQSSSEVSGRSSGWATPGNTRALTTGSAAPP